MFLNTKAPIIRQKITVACRNAITTAPGSRPNARNAMSSPDGKGPKHHPYRVDGPTENEGTLYDEAILGPFDNSVSARVHQDQCENNLGDGEFHEVSDSIPCPPRKPFRATGHRQDQPSRRLPPCRIEDYYPSCLRMVHVFRLPVSVPAPLVRRVPANRNREAPLQCGRQLCDGFLQTRTISKQRSNV
jgi:hypothetical protein